MDFKIGASLPHWSAPEHPDPVDLTGLYCRLVPLDPNAHSKALFKAFADDTADFDWVYLPYGPFNTNAQLEAWLKTVAGKKDPPFFTILNTHNQPIGIASYLRINPASGSIEVGHIHFSPTLQRTPAATEASTARSRASRSEATRRRRRLRFFLSFDIGFSTRGVFSCLDARRGGGDES